MRLLKCFIFLAVTASLLAGCSGSTEVSGNSESEAGQTADMARIAGEIGEACSSARALAAQNATTAREALQKPSGEDVPSTPTAHADSQTTAEDGAVEEASAPHGTAGGSADAPTSPPAARQHSWEPIVETREVVVQEGYCEDHYVVYVHNYVTGEDAGPYESYEEAEVYMDSVMPQRTSCGVVNIGSYQPRITTTEDVVVGYRCTGCGATK